MTGAGTEATSKYQPQKSMKKSTLSGAFFSHYLIYNHLRVLREHHLLVDYILQHSLYEVITALLIICKQTVNSYIFSGVKIQETGAYIISKTVKILCGTNKIYRKTINLC